MSATVTIAGDTRNFSELTESWVTQQVNRRQQEGVPVCIVVKIETGDVNVTLATAGCGNVAGGGRVPTRRESEVFDLWRAQHLNTDKFSGGNVIAFLKQIRSYL